MKETYHYYNHYTSTKEAIPGKVYLVEAGGNSFLVHHPVGFDGRACNGWVITERTTGRRAEGGFNTLREAKGRIAELDEYAHTQIKRRVEARLYQLNTSL